LVEIQSAWANTLSKAARISVEEGHFRPGVDPDQFAFELQAVMLGYHHASRLMRDPHAKERTRQAAERLVQASRVSDAPLSFDAVESTVAPAGLAEIAFD